MRVYEVKKFSVTLFMGPSYAEADACYRDASPGETTLYSIRGGKKFVLNKK
jgi:hypothetical protein